MANRKIVFTNGIFDLFHVGHLKLLYEAKKLGDELYVGINSDISVKKLKGPLRPIIPDYQRFEIIASIKYVNRVFLFDELTPIELIKKIMPDVIVKGSDYNLLNVVGIDIAEVVIVPLIPNMSTSKIIDKIIG